MLFMLHQSLPGDTVYKISFNIPTLWFFNLRNVSSNFQYILICLFAFLIHFLQSTKPQPKTVFRKFMSNMKQCFQVV